MTKYIFVTGGVVSSLGKGVTASSLGMLLKNHGIEIFMQKFDPYLNVDPGTMSPYQHGEVFVTVDGVETDLDLGHYERFTDTELSKNASVSAGKIYSELLVKERKGDYLGATIQVIPHVTNMIKEKIFAATLERKIDVVITEIGGTAGDIESLPFIEAIRQIKQELGNDNVLIIHNTLVPYLRAAKEIKTKPTQHSVKELRGLGVQPDILVLRTEVAIEEDIKGKIAMFCGVKQEAVIEARDVEILYEVPLFLRKQNMDTLVMRMLRLENKQEKKEALANWENLIETIRDLKDEVTIGFVGKYVELKDAYISVYEALDHAGYAHHTNVKVKRIQAEDLTPENYKEELKDVDGILVPGGFGERGVEGKMLAIQYARENNVPFLGICLGMQLAMIEFTRNVMGIKDANSTEFAADTSCPIIDYVEGQHKDINLGGSQRLGNYTCEIIPHTKAARAYQSTTVLERHRHRYEVNEAYITEEFFNRGLIISGKNPESDLVEIIELKEHPWFVAAQFHPEFTTRPLKPQPLFKDFIKHCQLYKESV